VKFEYINSEYQYYAFIYDELRHVKKLLPNTNKNNKKVLILQNDYYVNKDFIEENPSYRVINGMLYHRFQAFLCQEKEEAKEDLAF
jgi:hypothetical protein